MPDKKGETFQIVNHTKTKKTRRIAITSRAQTVLDEIKEAQGKSGKFSVWLFPDHTENGCITNNPVPKLLTRICKKCGIAISRDLIRGTHAFRRNFSTDVANASSIEDAAQMLGHTPEVDKTSYNAGMDPDKMRKILQAAGH